MIRHWVRERERVESTTTNEDWTTTTRLFNGNKQTAHENTESKEKNSRLRERETKGENERLALLAK